MSFDDFPRDSFNSTLSLRPTVWPTLYRSHLSPHLRSRHESKSTAFFRTSISAPFVPSIRAPRILSIKTPHIPSFKTPYIPSIKAPYIPSIKAPRIPSIRAPSIPHRAIPGTTRYISPGEHWDKKQTGSASLNGRDEYLTSRNGVLLPLPHDESPMVLGSALQVRQESESVSSSEGHCGRVICSPRYLAGNSSQGCTTDPVSTEYTMSFPDWPHVSDTNESKGRPVDDFTIRGTTSATIPVAHVAMTAPAPSPLGSRQCENSPSVSFGCRRSSFAGASTTAIGDQAEDYEMQSTLPSPSIEMSADREWSSRHITSHNPHRAILQSSPSYEKAVRVARPKVQHLSPSLRACLMCQLHKRKCDYGYPGQDRDNTKLHSKNLPCTHCKQMEEKQKPGYPSALYCFYPKPCEKANNGCGRCGLLREQLLVGRPRSIWKDVKRKFRVKDQRWWRTHSQHTDSQRDPHSGRNPMLQAM